MRTTTSWRSSCTCGTRPGSRRSERASRRGGGAVTRRTQNRRLPRRDAGGGLGAAHRLPATAPGPPRPRQGGARGVRSRRAAAVRPEQHPLRHEHAHRRVGAGQERALRAARRAAPIRSCGTSAPPRATTSCSRRGSRRRTSAPASRRCAARCPSRPASRTGSAREIAHELRERGLQDEPLGIDMADLVTIEALQRAGVQVTDGSQVMLEARKIKTAEEIALLDQSAGLVDAVYEEIYRMLRPGVYEHEIVARAHQLLFEMGSEQVEAINAVSGDRCNPHPHVFSDRLLRPGDQAFFDIIHSFMGYRTCYYRTFNVGGVSHAQLDAYKQCREWLDAAIDARPAGHDDGQDRRGLADRRGARLPGRGDVLRPPVRARHRRRALRVADDLARPLPRASGRARGGDGVRARDVLRRDRRPLRGADRGGGRRHGDRLRRDHALPGRGAAGRRPDVRARRRSRRRRRSPRTTATPVSPPRSRPRRSSSPAGVPG